jgi:homoserine O-acetyltransferase/O-succinyltransferase
MAWARETGIHALGDLPLQSSRVLRNAKLGWTTHGTLRAAKDNVIVYSTSYSAQAVDLEWLIAPDGILDPTRWFIVIINAFGNGISSSPSNDPDYPALVTAWDGVHAQRRLLSEQFGIERIACVYGWSMGAQMAYHWAAAFPEVVASIVVNCGSARTAVHNQVFLAGLMSVLEAAPEFDGGSRFRAPPKAALRAFARIYAGWALSQDFYRADLHLAMPNAATLEDFLRVHWEERYAMREAADLYSQLRTWHASDISNNSTYGGDLERALRAIRARVLLMPGETDLYFRVADNEMEKRFLASAQLSPIPSIWGHRAGNPAQNPADAVFIRDTVRRFLAGS